MGREEYDDLEVGEAFLRGIPIFWRGIGNACERLLCEILGVDGIGLKIATILKPQSIVSTKRFDDGEVAILITDEIVLLGVGAQILLQFFRRSLNRRGLRIPCAPIVYHAVTSEGKDAQQY